MPDPGSGRAVRRRRRQGGPVVAHKRPGAGTDAGPGVFSRAARAVEPVVQAVVGSGDAVLAGGAQRAADAQATGPKDGPAETVSDVVGEHDLPVGITVAHGHASGMKMIPEYIYVF